MIASRLSPAFEFKLAGSAPSGIFTGYASTFNGPQDSYGDVIAPGAFTESLAEHQAKGVAPAMLWAHDTDEPIGSWRSIKQDAYGLAVEGKLTLGTRRGAEAHALMKDDALALSIGFSIRTGGATHEHNRRILKAVNLFEISAVAMPANPAARVTSVKAAQCLRPENIRDFEAALRDACGFSVREAKRIASAGWPALMRRDDSNELNQIADMFNMAAKAFQPHQ